MKKYELIENDFIDNGDTKLYRIKAIIDFDDIKKGDIGGYVEREENLSHNGNCWIYKNTKVFGNAIISGNAKVYINAIICGNAEVFGNAIISGNAKICGNAKVYRNAKVSGSTIIYGSTRVFGNAEVSGYTIICGNAEICGNAVVYDNARISGNAKICGNAKISESFRVSSGTCTKDISKDLKENIRCQCNLGVFNNKVIAYNQVKKDMTSFYDETFKYEIGKVAEVTDYEKNKESCDKGLQFSNINYWNHAENIENSIFLMAEIDIKDIITVQEGKIRCSKAKILAKYEIED